MTAAAGAALAVTLLTGCTGTEEEPPEVTGTEPAVPTDAPTDVSLWVSVAETQKLERDMWMEGWESVECGSIDELETASIDCLVLVYQAASTSDTAAEWWDALTTPGHAEFLSTVPPEEVADLVSATKDAAIAASTTGQEWVAGDCGSSAAIEQCPELTTALGDALTAFDEQLAAWEQFFL